MSLRYSAQYLTPVCPGWPVKVRLHKHKCLLIPEDTTNGVCTEGVLVGHFLSLMVKYIVNHQKSWQLHFTFLYQSGAGG